MPRIRSIKPDFFTSETVSLLPLRTRLTWVGLWTHCDDYGRCRDNPKLVKAAVWPLDDVSIRDIECDLNTLADSRLIARYEVDGRRYIQVVNWREHQKVSHPSRSSIPPPEGSGESLEDSRDPPMGGDREQGAGRGEGERSRPRCSRHRNLPDDDPGPNCIGCRDARLDAEKPKPTVVPDWCGECDEHSRQIEVDDRVGRCPTCHPHRSSA